MKMIIHSPQILNQQPMMNQMIQIIIIQTIQTIQTNKRKRRPSNAELIDRVIQQHKS